MDTHTPLVHQALGDLPTLRDVGREPIGRNNLHIKAIVEALNLEKLTIVEDLNGVDLSDDRLEVVVDCVNTAVAMCHPAGSYPLHSAGPRMSTDLASHVVSGVMGRVLSDAKQLNCNKSFSSSTYGEVSLPQLEAMVNELNLTEEDVIIDLGSGVGNACMFFAAACKVNKVVGIELNMVPAAAAEKMLVEFDKTCSWYGKEHSPIFLERCDFMHLRFQRFITEKATLIFVNNLIFEKELQKRVTDLIREIKPRNDGRPVRIISTDRLAPDISEGWQITQRLVDKGELSCFMRSRTMNEPGKGDTCSWSPKKVDYYLHTFDYTAMENFYKSRMGLAIEEKEKDEEEEASSTPTTPKREDWLMEEHRRLATDNTAERRRMMEVEPGPSVAKRGRYDDFEHDMELATLNSLEENHARPSEEADASSEYDWDMDDFNEQSASDVEGEEEDEEARPILPIDPERPSISIRSAATSASENVAVEDVEEVDEEERHHLPRAAEAPIISPDQFAAQCEMFQRVMARVADFEQRRIANYGAMKRAFSTAGLPPPPSITSFSHPPSAPSSSQHHPPSSVSPSPPSSSVSLRPPSPSTSPTAGQEGEDEDVPWRKNITHHEIKAMLAQVRAKEEAAKAEIEKKLTEAWLAYTPPIEAATLVADQVAEEQEEEEQAAQALIVSSLPTPSMTASSLSTSSPAGTSLPSPVPFSPSLPSTPLHVPSLQLPSLPSLAVSTPSNNVPPTPTVSGTTGATGRMTRSQGKVEDSNSTCICRKPFIKTGDGMQLCHACLEWFHFECLKIPPSKPWSFSCFGCQIAGVPAGEEIEPRKSSPKHRIWTGLARRHKNDDAAVKTKTHADFRQEAVDLFSKIR